ncbi:MAG: bifunctional precorrin-2 dehydrogenase/sirohydrochlorin ferrochelatase [Chloroflexi bacterium]|nr:bifunctional precorrin-2 dehydrogenase/sirohydrochlorin ferrochelatase [Chloroflexota bacterium]
MPTYYPVFLDVRGRRCAVVGGGREAERKTRGLLECGAQVTVVAPLLTPALGGLAQEGRIDWKARGYQPGDLAGFFLAIAESDDPKVYRQVALEAERTGVLLNVIDMPHLCTFVAPAVVRRGEVAFAISTAGLSPALSRRLKEEVARSPVLRWADLAEMLAEVRLVLRKKRVRPHPDRWQECMDEELLTLFHSGRREDAKQRLLAMLQEQPAATGDHR